MQDKTQRKIGKYLKTLHENDQIYIFLRLSQKNLKKNSDFEQNSEMHECL